MSASIETLESLRKRPHWSFSQINSLLNFCSLAWAFHYVYKEEKLFAPIAPVFGGAFHSALAFHMTRKASGRDCAVSDCIELFSELLRSSCRTSQPPLQLKDGSSIDGLVESGTQMLRAYLQSQELDERLLSVSVPFSVPLIDASGQMLKKPLIGEFDLTVEADGVYTIVDWKTSAKRWPAAKPRTDLQPTCYLWAHYRATGDVNAQFRFDVVTKTKIPTCDKLYTQRTPNDFMRLGELVRVLDRVIDNECFYPADSSWECTNCPYSLACQSWHREKARTHVHFELAA